MKIIFIVLFAYCFICFEGCIGTTLSGYEYETKAVYKAFKSNLLIRLVANGRVKPGEDVGIGVVNGCIYRINSNDSINFVIEADTLQALYKNNQKKSVNKASGLIEPIMAELDASYKQNFDSIEINEIEKIILSIGYGPKATILKGQTKALEVERVDFKRK